MHDRWDYAELLHARGFRVTPQRTLILDAVCAGDGHTTLEEIYARVRARASRVNRATLYRNLDFLCQMRLVVAAQIGGRTVYEIAGDEPHHHLVCRACGQTEPLPHTELKPLLDRLARRRGFQVDMDHVTLTGLCRRCRRPGPRTGR